MRIQPTGALDAIERAGFVGASQWERGKRTPDGFSASDFNAPLAGIVTLSAHPERMQIIQPGVDAIAATPGTNQTILTTLKRLDQSQTS